MDFPIKVVRVGIFDAFIAVASQQKFAMAVHEVGRNVCVCKICLFRVEPESGDIRLAHFIPTNDELWEMCR